MSRTTLFESLENDVAKSYYATKAGKVAKKSRPAPKPKPSLPRAEPPPEPEPPAPEPTTTPAPSALKPAPEPEPDVSEILRPYLDAMPELPEEPEPPAATASDGLLDPAIFAGRKPITETKRIRWIRDHLDVHVEPEDCPDAGAWSQLNWARAHRNEFFKTLAPKLMPRQSEIDAAASRDASSGRVDGVLDRLIAIEKSAREQDADKVQDAPTGRPRVLADTPRATAPEFEDMDL